MANKSNRTSEKISTPQGGGALHDIDETFSKTGNFTVPLAVSPGRNGFQPQFSLRYRTGNGNAPYGLGWSFTIPGVSRKTSRGIPRYRKDRSSRHESDTFILSRGDLVPLTEQIASLGTGREQKDYSRGLNISRRSETNHLKTAATTASPEFDQFNSTYSRRRS
ncbi:MAG TPA: SpvB/TcaC N-terminal domain-containing protein [Pyrinomonadaceae bacterium]|nr:SpvB/TcaC N-terminal domain-containing protein [Pyrinomonadaceae bacterium]